jgi:hypothetical protein
MESQKSLQRFMTCSGEQAWDIGRRLIELESRGHGDVEAAFHRLQAKTGIDYWQWWAFRYRTAPKHVLTDTWLRLVSAYRIECERKAREYCNELSYAASLAQPEILSRVEASFGGHADADGEPSGDRRAKDRSRER